RRERSGDVVIEAGRVVVVLKRVAARQQAHPAEFIAGVDFESAVVIQIGWVEQRDGGEGGAVAMEREHRAQVEIEDRVAVGDYECIFVFDSAQELPEAVERAAGAEQNRLGRIRDAQSEPRSVAEAAPNNGR